MRTRWRNRRARDPDFARYAAQDAEQRQQQFALALPVEAAQSNDFAGFGGERNVAQPVGPAQVPDLEERRRAVRPRGRLRRKDVAIFAPDHHLDDLVVGLGSGGVGRDIGAVPEHRAFVGELGDLMHAVGDEQERKTLLAQALQDHEHLGDVGCSQGRGRLVEDEDAGLARQRLGDLHHLAARQRQVLDQRQRMDVRRAGALERFLGEAPLRASVDHSEAPRRIGDRNVVGDRKVGNERQLLEDAHDPGAIGGGGRVETDLGPVEDDASGIRRHHARQDLDERRLAGAVLAENGVNAPRKHNEIGAGERSHAAVTLGYALHAQNRRGRRLKLRHAAKPRQKSASGRRDAPAFAATAAERFCSAGLALQTTCFPSSVP